MAERICLFFVNRHDDGIPTKSTLGATFLGYIHLRCSVMSEDLLGVIGITVIHRIALFCYPTDGVG